MFLAGPPRMLLAAGVLVALTAACEKKSEPAEAVPAETPAQRAAREADSARIRYGVSVTGANCSVRYEKNLFVIRSYGDAVQVEQGGTATEGDGNEFVGKGRPRSSGD